MDGGREGSARGFVVVHAHDDEVVRVGEGAVELVVHGWITKGEATAMDGDEEGILRGAGAGVAFRQEDTVF